jgi:cell division protein FtsQ
VAPHLSGSFFTLDLVHARKVFEGVPWVRQAVVRREFPDQLRVDLQEHQPVALWGSEAESRLLNHLGEVFEANTAEVDVDSLVRLLGPDTEAENVLSMYRALMPQFEELGLHMEQFEMSGSGGWRVHLESGAVVELGGGSNDEVQARTRRFLRTLTQVTARHARKPDALESADLRHADGYALRLQGVTTLVPDPKQK